MLNNIKQIRLERGLSLREVADLSNLSHATINNIEKGISIPSQLSMLQIGRGLNMPVCQIFDLKIKVCTCDLCLTKDTRRT